MQLTLKVTALTLKSTQLTLLRPHTQVTRSFGLNQELLGGLVCCPWHCGVSFKAEEAGPHRMRYYLNLCVLTKPLFYYLNLCATN